MKNNHINIKSDAPIELAQALCYQNDFEAILRMITQKAIHLMDAEIALIMMINPRTHQTLKTVFSEGKSTDTQAFHLVHTNISGWVLKNETSFISKDIKTDSRFRKGLFKNVGLKSVLCTLLRCENIVIGTLLVLNKTNDAEFKEVDLAYLEKLASIVSPFLRNVQKIEHYFTPQISKNTIIKKYEALGLLGKSQKFIELLQAIEAAARCDVRVLLEGSSGTGKELIAKAIHACSERSGYPFIAVDCGAIPENLIESELFGHVKGAFTGAAVTRKGLFEEADQGTLFMDEITNLPMDLQAKLLRVLQEGEIRPLGSNTPLKVNVRVITAASIPLRELVNDNLFREDLFYRLLVYPIHVPSLEERQEDIPLLANYFIKRFSDQQHKNAESFHEEVIDFIKLHQWQGNIRELENFVERMVTLVPKEKRQIDSSFIPPELRMELEDLKQHPRLKKSLTESLAEYEEKMIRKALTDNHWNQARAARALGISEQTMRYKMQKLNIKKS